MTSASLLTHQRPNLLPSILRNSVNPVHSSRKSSNIYRNLEFYFKSKGAFSSITKSLAGRDQVKLKDFPGKTINFSSPVFKNRLIHFQTKPGAGCGNHFHLRRRILDFNRKSYTVDNLTLIRSSQEQTSFAEERNSTTASTFSKTRPALKSREKEMKNSGKNVLKSSKRQKGEQNPTSTNGSSLVKSTLSYVQILGTGLDTEDTAPSVLLFFENRRYIFNAGEGMQRFCIEHKVRFTKIDNIFLTRVSSETAGGLPGLLLTLVNMDGTVKLSGPSNLQFLINAMKTFVPRAAFVDTVSFGGEEAAGKEEEAEGGAEILVLEDPGIVNVSAVILKPRAEPNKTRIVASDDFDAFDDIIEGASGGDFMETASLVCGGGTGSGRGGSPRRVQPEMKQPGGNSRQKEGSESLHVSDFSVVYICELPETAGKFDPEKAKQLGLRPSKKYGLLQKGETVESDDGSKTIHPSDVMLPPIPGAVFLLVDCPTKAHLPSLLHATGLKRFYQSAPAGSGRCVNLVVHLGPQEVVQSAEYRDWLARLGNQTTHVFAGYGRKEAVGPILASSAKTTARLNFVCPPVFPAVGLGLDAQFPTEKRLSPAADMASQEPQQKGSIDSAAGVHVGPTFQSQNLMKFCLRPHAAMGIESSDVPAFFSLQRVQRDLAAYRPEVVDAAHQVAALWDLVPCQVSPSDSPEAPKPLFRESMEDDWLMESAVSAGTGAEEEEDGKSGRVEGKMGKRRKGWKRNRRPGSADVPECLRGIGRREMEMVFLGTGSSMPSKYRNVSAIYVDLFDRGGMLMDCGEGTYAQLRRRYGNEGADAVIARLGLIWISHIHADHHAGIVRILAVRQRLLGGPRLCPPLLVVGPRQLKHFLDAYERLEGLGFEFLDCSQTTLEAERVAQGGEGRQSRDRRGGLVQVGDRGDEKAHKGGLQPYWVQPGGALFSGLDGEGRGKLGEALEALGLRKLQSVPVVHCPNAYGVLVEAKERVDGEGKERRGWKMVYSGDTRPCKALVEASEGATVLIHEATFDDGLQEDAIAKRHSMTREAIETGVAAGVYRTILTHFSQRYPKIPVIDESYTDKTCIAFDMMSANLADLPVLPQLLPSLRCLFRQDIMEAEEAKDELQSPVAL